MKRISRIVATLFVMALAGCVTVDGIIAGADSFIKSEAANQTDPQVKQSLTLVSTKLETLRGLYDGFSAASANAKPGLGSQIEGAVQELVSDDAAALSLAGVKNPGRLSEVENAIAAVEAAIVAVQDKAPAPSGNSVQLNSTTAQMQAAVKKM